MNYMDCLGSSFPNIQAICFRDPFNYNDIQWEGGDPLPSKVVLDECVLHDTKAARIKELSLACEKEIIGGFESSALGTPAIYDSERVDQLNLIGATTATGPVTGVPEGFQGPYAVRPVVGGVIQPKEYVMHTYSQLRGVLLDGFNFKLARLQKFNDKRDYVNNVTATLADIDAVTWDSVETPPTP